MSLLEFPKQPRRPDRFEKEIREAISAVLEESIVMIGFRPAAEGVEIEGGFPESRIDPNGIGFLRLSMRYKHPPTLEELGIRGKLSFSGRYRKIWIPYKAMVVAYREES